MNFAASLHSTFERLRSLREPMAATALAALAMAPASAHETWLLPSSTELTAGENVRFALTSGMGFPAPGAGIDRIRVVEAVLLQGEERQSLVPSGAFEDALELTATPQAGLACSWVQLTPRILEIPERDSIEHYLEEIGAGDDVYESWHAQGPDSLWRESYGKLARNYVAVTGGDGEASSSCLGEASSARFDILPLSDPTGLTAGATLEVQLLFDGEPLAGQSIGLMREGAEPAALQRSDSAGRVTLTMEGAGLHMIYATNIRPAPDGDNYNWESDFVTLSFRVSES